MLNLRSSRGFSLIELMIAIALLGILLLVALPAFSTMLANLRVRSVADSVLSGIQAARSEALKRNATVRFRLDSGAGGGWSIVLVSDNSILQSKSAVEGGGAQVTFGTGTTVEFNNLGRRSVPTAAAIRILDVDISSPAAGACEEASGRVRCLRIEVATGGAVRLCDPVRAAGDPQACL
jgi:type IV fimbrial biogenesis protein FimT